MSSVIVKRNHLKYAGKQYFRGGAEDVLLGSYGEKKTPIFGANYLEVQDTITPANLKVRSATECAIDFSKSIEFSVSHSGVAKGVIDGVPVKVAVNGIGSVDFGSEGHLRLVKLVVEPGDIESALEDEGLSNVLDKLKSFGGDARICHEIFVVMEANLSHSLSASGRLSLSGSGDLDGVKVSGTETLEGGQTRTTSVTISHGTTFAYLLLNIKWNEHKTKIEILTDDQWGMN